MCRHHCHEHGRSAMSLEGAASSRPAPGRSTAARCCVPDPRPTNASSACLAGPTCNSGGSSRGRRSSRGGAFLVPGPSLAESSDRRPTPPPRRLIYRGPADSTIVWRGEIPTVRVPGMKDRREDGTLLRGSLWRESMERGSLWARESTGVYGASRLGHPPPVRSSPAGSFIPGSGPSVIPDPLSVIVRAAGVGWGQWLASRRPVTSGSTTGVW